jgi:DNA repair protein REV1
MDCFFASVVLRNYPQYRDKPVAISHHGKGNNPQTQHHEPPENNTAVSKNSTSECATCNYKAREYGIQKGMFLGRAKQLCPELIVLFYDFDGYEEVSEQVLEILHKLAAEHNGTVEAVSCDEAYMELFLENNEQAGRIAESTRTNIFKTTQCTASIGVANNKFLAKVGTDRAKPDGSFVVTDYKDLLKDLKLRELHGIGYRSEPKLTAEGLVHVQDIWDCNANAEGLLCRILGPALGRRIFDFCQGKDDRPVKAAERKTIGAEVSAIKVPTIIICNYFIFSRTWEVQLWSSVRWSLWN